MTTPPPRFGGGSRAERRRGVDWLLLETQTGAGGQVLALRISDDARRVVHRGDQKDPLRAALDPTGRMVAVDIRSRSNLSGSERQRAALVHLERGDRIWLPQSLDRRWRLSGVTFDETGRRLAFEGARDGDSPTEIYVADFEVSGFSIRDTPIAVLRHPDGLALREPTFINDGETLLFFEEIAGGRGDRLCWTNLAATAQDTEWPLINEFAPLVADLELISSRGLVYDREAQAVYVVARGHAGDTEQIYRVPLDGGSPRPVSPAHGEIEVMAIAAGEDRLAYAADEALRLVVGDDEPILLVRVPGGRFGGLVIDAESDCLWYVVNEPTHATLCAVLLPDGGVHPVARLNQERALRLIAVPDHPWLSEHLDGLTPAAVLPETPVADVPTAVDYHQSVRDNDLVADGSLRGSYDSRITASFGSLGTYEEGVEQSATIDEPPATFADWMASLATSDDPSGALLSLESRRDDNDLVIAARTHLESLVAQGVEGGALFFAIAAVAHLGDHDARPILLSICEPARTRVVEEQGLPEAEEHFALAAMRYLDGHTDRFAAMVIYEEYETIIQQASGVLERDGGTAATKLVTFFLQLYAEQFADVLDLFDDDENDEITAFDAFSKPPDAIAPVPGQATSAPRKTIPHQGVSRPDEGPPRDEESLEWRTRRAEAERVADEERFRPLRGTFNRLPPPTSDPLSVEADALPNFASTGGGSVDHVDLRLSGIDGQRREGPSWLGAAALAGGAAGLILAVLSGVLGSIFAITGALWIVGCVGLFANRRWGWILGLAAYAINGGLLVGMGIWGTPPQWITPAGLVIGGLVTFVFFALLLPHARRRLSP